MDFNHRPSASQADALYRLSYTSLAEKRRFELPQDCSRHLSRVLPYQLGDFSKWKRAEESNPKALNPCAVFRTVYPHGCYPPKELPIVDCGLPIAVKVSRCSHARARFILNGTLASKALTNRQSAIGNQRIGAFPET